MANSLRRRLREAVSASAEPQLQRGVDDVEDEDDDETTEPKRGRKRRKAKAREATALHILLREANVARKGSAYEVTIVREGPGNPEDANYYTAQALREAVAKGLFEGLRAYLNHPTPTEERERPERDVRYLAGHFREARFVDGKPAEVRAKFIPGGMDRDGVVALIESALESVPGRPLVGISIDGYGHAPDQQEVGGRLYNMVREVTHLGSADIVTRAGAGGRFHRRLQEAWRATEEHVRISERDFSAEERGALAKKGQALSDGSYPIPDKDALRRAAILAASGHGDVAAAKSLIRRRARELGVDVSTLPGFGGKKKKSGKARESNPAAQAGPTLKEGTMKPAKLQEKVKAAVAKLREASGLDENESERADTLIREAVAELDQCATAELTEPKAKVEIREVEKPVAASDEHKDKLAAKLAAAEQKLQEAAGALTAEKQRRKDAESERDTLKASSLAAKVLREAEIPQKTAREWFDELVGCEDEQAMRALVERKKEARNELLSELRESVGVEGVPARPPSTTAAGSQGDLLDRLGLDRDEYVPAAA